MIIVYSNGQEPEVTIWRVAPRANLGTHEFHSILRRRKRLAAYLDLALEGLPLDAQGLFEDIVDNRPSDWPLV